MPKTKHCAKCGIKQATGKKIPLYWLLKNGTGELYCKNCYRKEYLKYKRKINRNNLLKNRKHF